MNNYFAKNIIIPISDLFLGQNVLKCLKFLEESQFWDKNKIEEYQTDRLKVLIEHSYTNVEYYHNLFNKLSIKPSDIMSIYDLSKLPILEKDDIKKNFPDQFVAKNLNMSNLYKTGSSGSTGEPLRYFNTKYGYSFNIATNLRGWQWMNYEIGDRFVKLSQNPRKSYVKKIQDILTANLYLSIQQLTDANFSEIARQIIKYKPKIIRGYPDPLLFLYKYMKDNNLHYRPVAINTTGNILHPEIRMELESFFECNIFDSYSCEGSAVAFECKTHECYHLAMEYAITEIIDSKGNKVEEGKTGRHITTCLQNLATPFIRYNTQDYLVKSDRKCSCGRDLLAINQIQGRDSDILITPSKKYLIVHNFTGFFQQKENLCVDHFQVIQNQIDLITIKLTVNDSFLNSDQQRILKYWSDYIGKDVKVNIEIVQEIALTRSGKRRFIIRNNNIPFNL